MASKGGYVVPPADRARFNSYIQRANARIKANLAYIEAEDITDIDVKQSLVFDFHRRSTWAGEKTPLSRSTRFESVEAYKAFMSFIEQWGEDTGIRGDYRSSPTRVAQGYREAVYKGISGMIRNKGISLEEWGGDLPPELIDKIDNLSLTQLRHFFKYMDLDDGGDLVEYDSDGVRYGDVEDLLDYLHGHIRALEKYYPKRAKKAPKVRNKRR